MTYSVEALWWCYRVDPEASRIDFIPVVRNSGTTPIKGAKGTLNTYVGLLSYWRRIANPAAYGPAFLGSWQDPGETVAAKRNEVTLSIAPGEVGSNDFSRLLDAMRCWEAVHASSNSGI